VGHRVVVSSGAGPSGFIDGHTLSQMMTIMGDRAIRMFLPFFETDAADDTPVQDAGPRGHHFLKHTTSDQPPYIKGHVLAYRLNGVDEAFDMADHPDFSFGDSVEDSPFSLGIAVRFDDPTSDTLICRYDGTVTFEAVEYQLYTSGTGRILFDLYDNVPAIKIGRYYNTPLVEDVWYIIIGTYDGGGTSAGVRIYLNGVRVDDLNSVAGAYVAMHNEAVVTSIGYYEGGGGALAGFVNGDVWGSFIIGKELSAGEALSLTNLYRRVLGL